MGYWLLGIGYWLRAMGDWLLAIGYRLWAGVCGFADICVFTLYALRFTLKATATTPLTSRLIALSPYRLIALSPHHLIPHYVVFLAVV